MTKTRIIIRVEKDGKYVEKELTQRMVCALFDLQYMIDEVWDTIKLNKMDKDLADFFRIAEFIDDISHEERIGYNEDKLLNRFHITKDKKGNFKTIGNKRVWKKKSNEEYIFGKPRWRKIK